MAKESWIIGSATSCDVVVDSPEVSSRHCRLSWNGQTIMIRDLKSKSGTFVNGKPVTGAMQVDVYDTVMMGNCSDFAWPTALVDSWAKQIGLPATISIGRGPNNLVVLADPSVSTEHAKLVKEDTGWRLVDLQSTNGTSIEAVERKIESSIIQPHQKMFFGSVEWSFKDLHQQFATETTANSAQTGGESAASDKEAPPGTHEVATTVLHAVAERPLLLLGIFVVGVFTVIGLVNVLNDTSRDTDSESSVATREDAPATETQTPEPITPKVDEEDAPAILKSLAIVLANDPKVKAKYRFGTALAIASNQVVTTATVIDNIRNLQTGEGFDDLSVYFPELRRTVRVVDVTVHPGFELAKRNKKTANDKIALLKEAFEKTDKSQESFDKVRPELAKQHKAILSQIEIQVAHDVAVLNLDENIGHWIDPASQTEPVHPGLALTVLGHPYDPDDTYFLPDRNYAATQKIARMQRISQSDSIGNPSLFAIMTKPTDEVINNAFNGCPILGPENTVVALYSTGQSTPVGDEGGKQNDRDEVFQSPLWARVSECLSELKK